MRDAADPVAGVRAVLFDVFGTVVDWRNGVLRAARTLRGPPTADWAAVVDAWREGYQPTLDAVRNGELPWQLLDDVHRLTLREALEQHGLDDLGEESREALVRAWHRLEPWPDAVRGLTRLRTHLRTATLSNANVALLADLVEHGRLPFDELLSAEHAATYKPDPVVYLTAARLLHTAPERLMMVAAHADDLRAAAATGMRTGFVSRPHEWGDGDGRGDPPPADADIVADDLVELADRLLARVGAPNCASRAAPSRLNLRATEPAHEWLGHLGPQLAGSLDSNDWDLLCRFERDLRGVLASVPRDAAHVLTDPLAVKRRLASLGYGGLDVPRSLGGEGRSPLLQALVQFVCGYYDIDLRDCAHVGHGRLLIASTNGEQRSRWARRLLAGELVGVAATEPGGGSNLRTLRTTATPVGERNWRLSGEKCWISRIEEASGFIVFFADAQEGTMSAAVIDADAAGLRRTRLQPEGLEGWSWGRLQLTRVPISTRELLAPPGRAKELFEAHFDYYRPLVAATALGAAAAAHDGAVHELRERLAEGAITRPRDSTTEVIARTLIELRAAVAAVLTSQQRVELHASDATLWSRSVKGYAVETALAAVTALTPLVGAMAFQHSNPLAKARRDLHGFLYADGIHDTLFQSVGRALIGTGGRRTVAAAVESDDHPSPGGVPAREEPVETLLQATARGVTG